MTIVDRIASCNVENADGSFLDTCIVVIFLIFLLDQSLIDLKISKTIVNTGFQQRNYKKMNCFQILVICYFLRLFEIFWIENLSGGMICIMQRTDTAPDYREEEMQCLENKKGRS